MNEQSTGELDGVHKRRWWLAILSTWAGAGYLYVGRPKRYWLFLLFICSLLALLFAGPSSLLTKPFVFVSVMLIALLVCVAMVIDVVRLAVKQPLYQLQWFNRWWVYLASFI